MIGAFTPNQRKALYDFRQDVMLGLVPGPSERPSYISEQVCKLHAVLTEEPIPRAEAYDLAGIDVGAQARDWHVEAFLAELIMRTAGALNMQPGEPGSGAEFVIWRGPYWESFGACETPSPSV